MFYAQVRTRTRMVFAFPTKRLRDYVVERDEDLEPCKPSHAYHVMRMEQRNGPWGEHNGYDFIDMRVPEFWDGDYADMYEESHRLGLW